MKAVLVYRRPEMVFEMRAHNLSERQADEMVAGLRANGLEAYQIDQQGKHRGKVGNCRTCKSAGESYVQNLLPAVPAFSSLDIDEVPRITQPLSLGSAFISSQVQSEEGQRFRLADFVYFLRSRLPVIAGLLFFLLAISFLFRRFNPASGEQPAEILPTSTKTMAVLFTETPVPPTPTSRPTATRTPTELPTSTPTPTEEPACLSALDVTLDHLGESLCVEGTVTRSYYQEPAYYLIFGNAPGAFYMFSYDKRFDSINPGDCVSITGEIRRLKNNPVLVIGITDTLEACR